MRIKAFRAWRPAEHLADLVASVPYDVVNRDEAKRLAADNPYSFLHVVRAEIDLPDEVHPYSDEVYEQARRNLQRLMDEGVLIRETEPAIYLYSQRMDDHVQYGIVATCHVEDYEQGRIKIHEKTRRAKEEDRIRYVDIQNANTGPVFLAFRENPLIRELVDETRRTKPLYCFTAEDGIVHTVWKFPNPQAVEEAFRNVPESYVADGHHRSASAVKVAQMRRAANPNHTGEEPYNYFLAVFFPQNELKILPYNRVVFSLPGTKEEFLEAVRERFEVEENGPPRPRRRGEISMYLDGKWYTLVPRTQPDPSDPVASLDVSILQDQLLGPVLGIEDPRESDNIDFIGGIRGTEELERLVDEGRAAVAFSLYPTSMEELFAVADAGKLMPPKSTWFEPKLRSGLLVNTLD